MKGYKGMNPDMTCRGMQYEVGKSYHIDGDIKICCRGLHFCERLIDVFDYYSRDKSRFFEIEAFGKIDAIGGKSAASDMLIIREMDNIEINRAIYGYVNGNSYNYGNGNGYGDGNGYGNGNGYGYGYGYGNGYFYDNGYGYDNNGGYGTNIQKFLLFV